ncbi:hypothetical protein TNCV_836261 [Trichonephila clavipes]|nr:hypothetical protein TNCV_836261 [Trichonephila clavipes]
MQRRCKNTCTACDAEDCEFKMLNDDEIMTSVHEESDLVDDERMKTRTTTTMKCPVSYTAWIAFGFRLSEWCPVPIDLDKRRSTVIERDKNKKAPAAWHS